jgi:cytochrome oxidase Cu insertion factor (SCO1/SenC/PrrC family)
VIVDPQGKVGKIYSGNDWKPDEVVNELKKNLAADLRR